jgi:hypothetical protein
MIRASRRSCLSFLFRLALASCSLFLIAEPAREQSKRKELPKAAQEKIQKMLNESPGNRVMVFDEAGDETASTTVDKKRAGNYGSLTDFIKSDDSPAKSCKDPVPTPPPPCIICSSGQVVCSKASFSGKPQSTVQPRPHSGASQPEPKAPESEKPQ